VAAAIKAAGTRELVVPKFRRYVLIYDIGERTQVVTILRVWHASRQR